MADGSGKGAGSITESAIERIRGLNEQVVELARHGGEESIKTYERLLENLAEAQESAGARSAEWIQAFARAQASFTRELAEAFPALLQRLGAGGREVADAATAQARRVPGVAGAEGEMRGSVAREQDLPIANYDELRVDEINSQLDGLPEVDLAKIDAYERRTKERKTVLDKISSLRSQS